MGRFLKEYTKMKTTKMKKIILKAIAVTVIATILTPFAGDNKRAMAATAQMEAAIQWGMGIANDNSHGYSQSTRWGPDYDCSSFIISALRAAGLDTGAAVTTRNMRSELTARGFQWIPWSQIGGTGNLQRGDILLNEQQHTEIYLGNNQNLGAHQNYGYPQLGDQTGREISVSGYYNHPWDGVLRHIGGGNAGCNCSDSYAGEYTVAANPALNMRSGHSTSSSVIISIPNGSTVHVSKGNGSWAHVSWNGYNGYCSMDYLRKQENTPQIKGNLSMWLSEGKMGAKVNGDKMYTGKMYYVCYEFKDLNTNKRVNDVIKANYSVTEKVTDANGNTVHSYTYNNSDYNWIGFTPSAAGKYKCEVIISGDYEGRVEVTADVKENRLLLDCWYSESANGSECKEFKAGKIYYFNYRIYDSATDDYTTRLGNTEYSVIMTLYKPDGSVAKTQTFKNCTHNYVSMAYTGEGNYYGDIVVKFPNVEKKTDKQYLKIGHNLTKVSRQEPSVGKAGNIEYYKCTLCDKYFYDSAGTKEISDKKKVIIAALPTPTPKATATPKATVAPTPTATPKVTATPKTTATPTPKATATPTPIATP
nr:SH3 domain-containing protein [Acetatifactor sp.]